jgi:predicted secreted hydrolase
MRSALLLILLHLAAFLLWGAWALSRPSSAPDPGPVLSAAGALMGGDTAGYARALEPRPFRFPEDHGPHPDYRTEWWYLTGHLDGEEGEAFGFQFTLFRSALAPTPPERASAWSTRQLWMGHFALTDVRSGVHLHEERFARGAAGLAGGETSRFRVWLEDWVLEGDPDFPLSLVAMFEDGRGGIELEVEEGKSPVLQGDRGLSQKGPEPGNASFYVSWTRMPLRGTVTLAGRSTSVTGEGWMDREWSTSALGEGQVGWDWFSLQLSDGRELMYFELRRQDGTLDPSNHGVWVEPDGSYRPLSPDEVTLEVTGTWVSPRGGTRYPAGWVLRVPSEGVELRLVPRVPDQEMNVSFRYWEGALEVTGTSRGVPVTGRGYAELTGYAEAGGRT